MGKYKLSVGRRSEKDHDGGGIVMSPGGWLEGRVGPTGEEGLEGK